MPRQAGVVPLHQAEKSSVGDPAVGEHVEGARRLGRPRDLTNVVGVPEVGQQRHLSRRASVGSGQLRSRPRDSVGVRPRVRRGVAPWVEGYAIEPLVGIGESFVLQKVFHVHSLPLKVRAATIIQNLSFVLRYHLAL